MAGTRSVHEYHNWVWPRNGGDVSTRFHVNVAFKAENLNQDPDRLVDVCQKLLYRAWGGRSARAPHRKDRARTGRGRLGQAGTREKRPKKGQAGPRMGGAAKGPRPHSFISSFVFILAVVMHVSGPWPTSRYERPPLWGPPPAPRARPHVAGGRAGQGRGRGSSSWIASASPSKSGRPTGVA